MNEMKFFDENINKNIPDNRIYLSVKMQIN